LYASFSQALSRLRREKGVSQRQAAQALEVSQALLSHYENGIREPGLAFVSRACDYYQVSADYLLGRTGERTPPQTASQDQGEALLLRTADAMSVAWAELCRREPELAPLFRRLSTQLKQDLKC
jgi:transcriptional regulator with XRE-family HTH domain